MKAQTKLTVADHAHATDVADHPAMRPKPVKAGLRRRYFGRPSEPSATSTDEGTQGHGSSELTFERHLSVEALAELWGMSEDFVRRLFLKEPGVVVFYGQRPGRRVYRTLRIPESVALRVHRRMRKC